MFRQCGIFCFFTKSNRKIPHCRNNSKIQWKNSTLWEQFQNPIEKYHTVGTIPKSNIVPTVWYCSIGFWNCSDSVVFFYWILELFPQCGIFLLDFGIVPTVWYFSIGFWNCSHSVVHTVGTITKSNRKIPHCGNNSKIQWKNTTLSEQFQNPIEK
jgi:hypothetical protein